MPIKSKAQRRKFAALLVEGEITPEAYERWNREAGSAELPERLHPKARAKTKRRDVGSRASRPFAKPPASARRSSSATKPSPASR